MNLSAFFAFVLFALVLFFSSFISISLVQSSYAFGIFISSIIVFVLTLFERRGIQNIEIYKLWCWVPIFVIIHSVFAIIVTKEYSFAKSGSSLCIFLIVLLAANGMEQYLRELTRKEFVRSFILVGVVFTFIMVCSIALNIAPTPQYQVLNRPVFPFMEPSHFAIIVAPYLIWYLVIPQKNINKYMMLVLFGSLLLFINNLTFVCVLLLSSFVSLGVKPVITVLVIVCFLILLFGVDLDYYASRLVITDDIKSLSTLVWLQGWEEAFINLKDTYGIGVGFQQFGVSDLKGEVASIVSLSNNGEPLNRYDGGTLGAKIVGEFGIFGIILLYYMVCEIFKSIRLLLMSNISEMHERELFYNAVVVSFFIEFFVRGVGYFSPGVVTLMIVLISKYNTKYSLF